MLNGHARILSPLQAPDVELALRFAHRQPALRLHVNTTLVFGSFYGGVGACVRSGAEAFALNCPPDFVVQEEAHFYDCEEDLLQFDGEFHHGELAAYHAGDYVYCPVGTVYGHGEGSRDGSIIVASLARQRRRFHLQPKQKGGSVCLRPFVSN